MSEQYLTAREVGAILRCNERTVRRMVGRGDIPGFIFAGRLLVLESAIEDIFRPWLYVAPPRTSRGDVPSDCDEPWCEMCGSMHRIVNDHCHVCGYRRGWLCHRCNIVEPHKADEKKPLRGRMTWGRWRERCTRAEAEIWAFPEPVLVLRGDVCPRTVGLAA